MKNCNYVIHTDYGRTWLSQKTKDFLFSIDNDWEDLLNNKKRRGKNAMRIRNKMKEIEQAVNLLSEMAFSADEEFNEF